MPTLINIAEMKLSALPQEVLVATNLGSCLGIAAYDPQIKVGGMVHCLLPLSNADPKKAADNPYCFVDTGFAALLNELIAKGANRKHLVIVAVGGANINDSENVFEIGKRNYTALRKIMWKNGLLLHAEDIGGTASRTLFLEIGTGKCELKSEGKTKLLYS